MDYSKGKIYHLKCSITDKYYIGSTCSTLHDRLLNHKRVGKKRDTKIYEYMKYYGVDNFYINLIENWPCDNKYQLLKREGYNQVLYNTVNNGLNTRYAGLPLFIQNIRLKNYNLIKRQNETEEEKNKKAEYNKQYRMGPSRASMQETTRLRTIRNSESNKVKNKLWYQENKEKYQEKAICSDCNKEMLIRSLINHKKYNCKNKIST